MLWHIDDTSIISVSKIPTPKKEMVDNLHDHAGCLQDALIEVWPLGGRQT